MEILTLFEFGNQMLVKWNIQGTSVISALLYRAVSKYRCIFKAMISHFYGSQTWKMMPHLFFPSVV